MAILALSFAALAVGFQPWVLIPFLLAVAGTVIGYRSTNPELAPRRRAALMALRGGAFLLLLWMLLEPTLTRESLVEEPPTVLALLDRSGSMGHENGEGLSRFASARESIGRLAELAKERGARTTILTFAGGLLEAHELNGLSDDVDLGVPEGSSTDILASYREALERYGQENLAGSFLFSDGQITTGSRDYLSLGGRGVPLFSVGFGDTVGERDVGIASVDYSPIAFVDSRGEIRVRLETRGFAGAETTTRITRGDQVIQKKKSTISGETGVREVVFDIDFKEVGRQHYLVEVIGPETESNPSNNRADVVIQVLQAKMRVAFLDPYPSWDFSFLKRSLESDPNLECQFVYGHPSRGAVSASSGRDWSFPGDQGGNDYDLLIIRSCKESFFPATFAEYLTELVEKRGKSVLFLGGERSVFEARSWFRRFESILPVTSRGTMGQRYLYSNVTRTAQGEAHPVTAGLGRTVSGADAWKKLPPLLGYSTGLAPKGGTEVLLTVSADGRSPHPLLAVHPYGRGKVAAFMGIASWRWSLLSDDDDDGASFYDQLWSNLIRWLCRPEDVNRFSLRTPRTVYSAGDPVPLHARVFDENFQAVTGITPRITVRGVGADGGVDPVSLVLIRDASRPFEYSGSARGLAPGDYVARGEVEIDGEVLGSEDVEFTVSSFTPEFSDLRQDRDLLEGLAKHFQGEYLDRSGLDGAIASIDLSPRKTRIQRRLDLWNHPSIFFVVLIFLSFEWLLRKRFGLL